MNPGQWVWLSPLFGVKQSERDLSAVCHRVLLLPLCWGFTMWHLDIIRLREVIWLRLGWLLGVGHAGNTLGHVCQSWAEVCASTPAYDGEELPEGYQARTPIQRPCAYLPGCFFSWTCIHAMGRPQCMARSAPKLYGALDPKLGGESPLQPHLPATSPHSRVEVDGSGKELFTLWYLLGSG